MQRRAPSNRSRCGGLPANRKTNAMPFAPLHAVRQRIELGRPLPFNVLNRDGTLLLAKGKIVDSDEQLQALVERGMLVDVVELFRATPAILKAPREMLPALWADSLQQMNSALRQADQPGFRAALDEASEPVLALVERDPDLAIFQVMRQDGNAHVQYGLSHSAHAAIVCRLVAHRLGWSTDDATRAFKAALTMNLGMLELQGRLASQHTPPSEAQRRQIESHPTRSREMLELAGVTDPLWLQAVEQHHEQTDGRGYPGLTRSPCELALMLQGADRYTTKLSSRVTREALPADRAGRELYMDDPSSPIHAAVVKEFGVYPPGCFVQLASGETGIVVARGPTVMAPVVAVLADERGTPLGASVRRDTTERGRAVAQVLPARSMRPPIDQRNLRRLALA